MTRSDAGVAPGFMVLQGNRLEDMVALMAGHLRRQPLAPLEPEVILIQSNGMKHWVELALADDAALGVCAATRLELPAAFLWQAYRAVLGDQAVPQHMPLDKAALVWRLVRSLPVLVTGDPVYAPLLRYLDSDADGRKRLQLAQQLADIFDGYQSYRADWLADWTRGDDVLRMPGGQTRPLPENQRWQPQLWRDILADVGTEPEQDGTRASRADVHVRFMEALRAWPPQRPRPRGLPPRIVVFGITSLPMQMVEALAALGQFCQVLMFVQNPCRYHWGDVVEGRELLRQVTLRQPVRPGLERAALTDLALLHGQAHPLLASWGRQGRDYLHLLAEFDLPDTYRQRLDTIDVFHDPADPAHGVTPTLLQRLQSDILHLRPLPGQPLAAPADDSITLVMAHSAQREVEVLHDRLLAWLDDDPTLRPQDIMVMVPDMAAFAPHIQAVFGRFSLGESRHIPYSVADQSQRQWPMARALEALLQLPNARITLSEWLDAFDVPAVRRRFNVTEDDVAQLHGWLLEAGVRWGLDAQHRRRWGWPEGMHDLDHNSWSFGMRRMLLGYASGDAPAWEGVAPLPAVSGLSAHLVGAMTEWLDAMDQALEVLQTPHPPAQWVEALRGLVERFLLPEGEQEERQYRRLLEPLGEWLRLCEAARLDGDLPLVVVREHWQAQWEAAAMHQRFFGGGVQFATLMPMRSIPFRVICLLGMNEADYPRRVSARDFDLMRAHARPGDRSRREDDRYLFLEALLSARDRLCISWQGRRASDDAEQPPSVLVAQLMDTMKACWVHPPEPCQYPLQPFSRRYFFAASDGVPPFTTYAKDWQVLQIPREQGAGADAQGAVNRQAAGPGLPALLSLRQLELWLREPVEWYFRERLGVRLDPVEQEGEDSEPFQINGLDRYLLGQSLLSGDDPNSVADRLVREGRLPLAGFGERTVAQLQREADTVRQRWLPWQGRFPQAIEPVRLEWAIGAQRFEGVVGGLRAGPDGWLQHELRPGAVLQSDGSRQVPRCHILRVSWLRHLALTACGHRVTTAVLGLDGSLWLPAMGREAALAVWRDWLPVLDASWQGPLPVSGKAAVAYAQASLRAESLPADKRSVSTDPLQAARKVFDRAGLNEGEHSRSLYLARAFDDFADIEAGLARWSMPLYGAMVQQVRVGTPDEEALS